ncbi:MAG: IS1 family transposase [Candidatus Electronema sp. VV]
MPSEKADTWRIERRNLNFRTHIKRLNRKQYVFQRTKKFMIMSSACISIVIILRTVDIQKVPDQRI